MNACGICCLVFMGIIIVFLLGCTFLQIPYWNRTFVTHAIPNIADFVGYSLDGRPVKRLRKPGYYSNGTKFADYESLIDRINTRDSRFIPPKQLLDTLNETFDMDPSGYFKFDSIPPILRDVALPRLSSHTRDSNIVHNSGSSIFVTNLEDRGTDSEGDNAMKRKYMAGLTHDDIQDYVQRCTPYMETALECMKTRVPHDCIFEAVQSITFMVHTHTEPDQEDRDFIITGAAGFSAVSSVAELADSLFMPWAAQKHILKHDWYIRRLREKLDDGTFKGLFKSLKDNDYRETDILVEYMHNVLALTLQWTILMEELVDTSTVTDATDEFIYNHIKENPTAAFVISSKTIDGSMGPVDETTHIVHAMKRVMSHHPNGVDVANAKACPFHDTWSKTAEGAVIAKGTAIIEEEGNWGFGRGYRRCSGEVLTLEMMKKWIQVIHTVDYNYTRGKPVGTFGFGYRYDATFVI